VSDPGDAEFSFAPSREEVMLGILEKRRWHRRYWIAVATFLPGAAALGVILRDLSGSDVVAAIPALGWIVVIVHAQLRANLLPCPRCGESFQTIGAFQRPWDPRCERCDLSLESPRK
jgi:hypothetical protein